MQRSGRLEEQIEILMEKVKRIEEEESIGGRRTKMARSQGKKVHITVEQEYSRYMLHWFTLFWCDFTGFVCALCDSFVLIVLQAVG